MISISWIKATKVTKILKFFVIKNKQKPRDATIIILVIIIFTEQILQINLWGSNKYNWNIDFLCSGINGFNSVAQMILISITI